MAGAKQSQTAEVERAGTRGSGTQDQASEARSYPALQDPAVSWRNISAAKPPALFPIPGRKGAEHLSCFHGWKPTLNLGSWLLLAADVRTAVQTDEFISWSRGLHPGPCFWRGPDEPSPLPSTNITSCRRCISLPASCAALPGRALATPWPTD